MSARPFLVKSTYIPTRGETHAGARTEYAKVVFYSDYAALEQRIKELEELLDGCSLRNEHDSIRIKELKGGLEWALTVLYHNSGWVSTTRIKIAALCNDHLDKSGELLERIRQGKTLRGEGE